MHVQQLLDQVQLMHTLDAERMGEVDAAIAAGAPRGDSEQMILGYTSVEIGGALARHWHFPDTLCEAVVRPNTGTRRRNWAATWTPCSTDFTGAADCVRPEPRCQ